MKTNVLEKELTIIECLQRLDKKEINKLFKQNHIVCNDSREEKEEILKESIINEFSFLLVTLTDKELQDLNDLIEKKECIKISKKLSKSNFLFKINDEIIVPKEIQEIYKEFCENNGIKERNSLAISIYLIINGVLEVKKMISLLKKSGINLTKQELLEMIKESEFIVKNNKIYFNEIAVAIDKECNLIEFKNEYEYKVLEISDMLAIMSKITLLNYQGKIKKILSKTIKDEQKLDYCVNVIYDMTIVGANFVDNIESLLEAEKIKLSKKDEKKLYDLIDTIYQNIPSWELNGYCPYEVFDEFDSDEDFDEDMINDIFESMLDENVDKCLCGCHEYESFEELTIEEQKDLYLYYYMMINGIMKIETILDILKDKHNYKITKKEIINIVNSNEDLIIDEDTIMFEGFQEEKELILSIKSKNPDYYIIKDVDEFLDDLDINDDRIFTTCLDYDLEEEEISIIKNTLMIGLLDIEVLKSILKEFNINLSYQKTKDLYKKLKNIQKTTRLWVLNGYRLCDCVNELEKSNKIGRNELCSCGSGKKYKHCCGK